MQIFIFGAGKGANHSEVKNQTFLNHLIKGKKVLDWTLQGLYQAGLNPTQISFVGGFNVESIIKNYPDINFVINPKWETTHVVGSMRYAMRSWEGGDVTFLFADTVFRPNVFKDFFRFSKDFVRIGIDSRWKDRIQNSILRKNAEKIVLSDSSIVKAGRNSISINEADAQFTGLITFNVEIASKLHNLFNSNSDKAKRPFKDTDSMTDLIGYIIENWKTPITFYDVANNWAELDSPSDLAKFVFGTKAETLERIKPMVKRSIICDQIHFRLAEWEENSEEIICKIQEKFNAENLIIRSSSIEEDSWESSQAGAFLSIANVPSHDKTKLLEAISEVIEVFQSKGNGQYNENNQVLVQPFISDVAMSGVAFSKQLEKGTPYFLINYDDISGRTDTITAGSFQLDKSITIYENTKYKPSDKRILQIVKAIKELKKVTGYDSLDIEFIITKNCEIYIVQVRPITIHANLRAYRDFKKQLKTEKQLIKSRMKPYPHLYGKTTVLADMPDWNPAEMISIRPNPLALSLYKYLITDSVWRIARGRMGYHNPTPEKLLLSIGGHPYIDVRNSFNNLIPKGLSKKLAQKLINHYIHRLIENPVYHDKVEFKIVLTCYTPDIDDHAKRLYQAGLADEEINELKNALRKLTEDAISGKRNPIDELLAQTEALEANAKKLFAKKHKKNAFPGLIQYLLDDCIENGTIPFSILARYGFIASSMLKGLVAKGAITEDEKDAFLNSIDTIASELVENMDKVLNGIQSIKIFLERFGHLRPGSYDINSYSYDERPDYYFTIEPGKVLEESEKKSILKRTFTFSKKARHNIEAEISNMGMSFSVDTLLTFIRKATAGREYAKFQFTKNLNRVLKLISEYGNVLGISRSDMGFLYIEDILRLGSITQPMDYTVYLRQKIQQGKIWYEQSHKVETPQIITSPKDLDIIVHNVAHPNYVTNQSLTAPVCMLTSSVDKKELEGKIVVIEGADPGYDWIFMHPIKGLITKYGGAASHMTIRCAEFSLPAAIGCGEEIFEKLLHAKTVELNCSTRQIRILE